ncbi:MULTISPECIES: hypothetical protein [Salinibaculum]|uniref:hypothetical protein n=1 Tax=Salinibaculum TaxID=2732368 RepID=UPI0030D5B0E2
MALQRIALGIGAGLTTFGIVAVVIIEAVQVDPVAGILGAVLGALFGLGVFGLVLLTYDEASPTIRRDVAAVAAFGYTALAVLALSYVNLAGLRSVIDPTVVVAVASLVAVLVWLSLWGRSGPRETDA